MTLRHALPILVLSAGLAGPARAQTGPTPVDGFAAKVNDRVILIGDVLNMIRPTIRFYQQSHTGEELEARVREAFRQGLEAEIEKALMIEEFRTRDLPISEVVVADRVDAILRTRFNNDRLLLRQALAEEHLTLEDWKGILRDQIVTDAMRGQEVRRPALPSPQAVYEAYRRRRDEFREPEEVRVRMIVIRGGREEAEREVKREEAERVRARLDDGEDFAVVARQVSEGAHASAGGDWGWIEPRTLRSELQEAVAALAPGQRSGVLEIEGAFYLLALEGRKPAREIPFEDVREKLREELHRAEVEKVYHAWIAQLRRNHRVEILHPF